MLKRKVLYLMFIACACALAWSCSEKETHLDVSPSQLYGEWVQDNDNNYHWTFSSDGTGSLIHTGSTEEGDEHNGNFLWTINGGDELEVEFRGSGELGGIDIVKLYTIKDITSSTLRWEDIVGRTTDLTKIL